MYVSALSTCSVGFSNLCACVEVKRGSAFDAFLCLLRLSHDLQTFLNVLMHSVQWDVH